MSRVIALQRTQEWFKAMKNILDHKGETKELKKLISEELNKIITGHAAVPSKKLLLAMREANMTPNDMAKMFHSQLWNETGVKKPESNETTMYIAYWEKTFAACDKAVDKHHKLIFVENKTFEQA